MHHDGVAAGAFDLRAHGDQAVRKINDFGLLRGVLDDGGALCQSRRHHDVLGAGDGDHVHHDVRALEPAGTGVDVAVFDPDRRTKRLQPADMLIHRPRPNRTATRQRYLGLAKTRHQRAQHQNRGTHGLDLLVGRQEPVNTAWISEDAHMLIQSELHTHFAEQGHRGGDIVQMRDVANIHGLIGEQAGRQNRQHRVLGAGNHHVAV